MADSIIDRLNTEITQQGEFSRLARLPSIGNPTTSPESLLAAIKSIKVILDAREGTSGSVMDKSLTIRDLMDAGALQLNVGSRRIGNTSGSALSFPGSGGTTTTTVTGTYVPPPTQLPTTPSNLKAAGTFEEIILNWLLVPYVGQSNVEVWRATSNSLGLATKIGISTSSMYVDEAISLGVTYYYWVRAVNIDNAVSSFNAVSGTPGIATVSPAVLLAILAGQITESQLYSALGARISLIDAADTVAGSVAARVKAERDARVLADDDTLSNAKAYTANYSYRKSDGEQVALNLLGLNSVVVDPATGLVATRAKLINDYATIAGPTNSLASVTTSLQAYATGAAGTAQSNAQNYTQSYAYALVDGNSLAGSVSTITAKVDSPSQFSGANYNPTFAALQIERSVRALLDASVQALYTVRAELSSGGKTMVGGFGFSATSTASGGPKFDFGVRADTFYVAAPAGSGVPDRVPFIIRTTTTFEGGQTIDPGVYMDAAYIVNLNALYARIQTLVAGTITAASISAAQLTIGDGTVGGNLKSNTYIPGFGLVAGQGWLLRPDGSFFANNATIYGTVYASNGAFGGSLSAATGTFAGELSAASGTFAGRLTAATGTFAGDISAATGTFAGGLNINSGGANRMEITNTRIKIFSGGVERVRIGDLS